MSNILKLTKNGNFYVDDNLLITHDIKDLNEYLMQLLGFYITIEDDVRLEEVVHSVFGLKKFISGYFSEDYEVVRAFSYSSKLEKKYKAIEFFKSFKVEDESKEFGIENKEEFLYVLPEVNFIEAGPDEVGYDKLGELPIIINENIKLSHGDIKLDLKSKFTLLDILSCLFDELSAHIKSGEILTVA